MIEAYSQLAEQQQPYTIPKSHILILTPYQLEWLTEKHKLNLEDTTILHVTVTQEEAIEIAEQKLKEEGIQPSRKHLKHFTKEGEHKYKWKPPYQSESEYTTYIPELIAEVYKTGAKTPKTQENT